VPVFFGRKGIVRFLRESARIDRGDATWLLRWPRAIFTRRFEKHEGEFDPGQRIANFAIVGGVLVLVGTGIGMTMLHGGSLFALLAKLHLVAAFLLTVVLAGHILIASGVFPGYRGVWRSMHGGRVPEETAKRLWPEWTEDGEPTDL
jgi:formate dehydrogenase subunit gamma